MCTNTLCLRRGWSLAYLARLCLGVFGITVLASCQQTASPTFVATGGTGDDVRFTASAPVATTPQTTGFAQPSRFVATGPRQVVLPNTTSLPGDNVLRVQSAGIAGGRNAGQLVNAARPLPAPFQTVIARDFVTSVDGLGQFHYTSSNQGGGVICVLALRAAPGSGGLVLLRNCVEGTLSDALAPINSLAAL